MIVSGLPVPVSDSEPVGLANVISSRPPLIVTCEFPGDAAPKAIWWPTVSETLIATFATVEVTVNGDNCVKLIGVPSSDRLPAPTPVAL